MGKGNVTIVVGAVLAGMMAILIFQLERVTSNHELGTLTASEQEQEPPKVEVQSTTLKSIQMEPKNLPPSSPREKRKSKRLSGKRRTSLKVPRDFFRKLKTYEKMIKRVNPPPQTKEQFIEAVNHELEFEPEWLERLIEYRYPRHVSFNEGAVRDIRRELANAIDGRIIFQDYNYYFDLRDKRLDPQLPVCIVDVKQSHSGMSITSSHISMLVKEVVHPVTEERNFRGVRLVGDSYSGYELSIKQIECGFISDVEPNDEYKKLEYMHLHATIPTSAFD